MSAISVCALAMSAAVAAADAWNPVQPWAPRTVSSDQFESHGAFDPINGDFYFVRSSPKFEGWRIKVSRCSHGTLLPAVDAAFAGDGVEADPWFDASGRRLYFISTRTSDGVKKKDLDVWEVTRSKHGFWGEPRRMPASINSDSQEWFPRMSADGWLYFGSGRPGGFGKTDIWRARRTGDGWTVENAGAGVNSSADEYEALPSPDGRTMLIETADGYYESRRADAGWGPRVRLGSDINVNGSEIGAAFSPSGRSVLFARDVGPGRSGEFLVWHRSGDENWPRPCGSRRGQRFDR